MPYLVIYKLPKEIKFILLKNEPRYKVGDYNSYGWEILGVYIYYSGKFISLEQYEKELKRERLEYYKKVDKRKRLSKIFDRLSKIFH